MKLSKRQTTALEKSIKKWELIVLNDGGDNGTKNCELCKVYFSSDCNDCPVMIKTGVNTCGETPYSSFCQHASKNPAKYNRSDDHTVFDAKSKELAQAELDFLRGILAEAT